jgi:hypothetical protein
MIPASSAFPCITNLGGMSGLAEISLGAI